MTTEQSKLADDCELYAKIIEGIVIVANDYKDGDPERREPRETLLKAAAALRAPSPDTRVREALEKLQSAELTYRTCHDLDGDGHINTGRAWDKLRRSGARARSVLTALTQPGAVETDDWKDDPSSDERWSVGVDCVMKLLCEYLGVDPDDVTWDAATETVDGDISAVIGNILRAKFGEDWGPSDGAIYAAVSQSGISETEHADLMRDVDSKLGVLALDPATVEALQAAKEFAEDEFSTTDDLRRKHLMSLLCDKLDRALIGQSARNAEVV